MRRTRSSNPLLRSLCFSVSKYTETSVVRVGAPRVRGRKLELYFDFLWCRHGGSKENARGQAVNNQPHITKVRAERM
jgi:hypothetical protein